MSGVSNPKPSLSIANVQIIRKMFLAVAAAVGVFLFALTRSRFPSGTLGHEMVEWLGITAIVVCILGRTWCSLYIGGRKIEQFVTVGPYSVTRNPLYLFSILGAAGAGAQMGSVVVALFFGLLAWLTFRLVIVREEQVLAERYGSEFASYRATVPRLVPNPRLWRDLPVLTIMPPRVIRTFADAMLFLLAIPVAEAFERLQTEGVLPVLLYLP